MQGRNNVGKIACMSELTSLKKGLAIVNQKNDEVKKLPAHQPDEVEKDLIIYDKSRRKEMTCIFEW